MKKGNKMKRGFTLIELITVVIIIAILSALALPQYTRFIERSQGSTARTALGIMRKAEATYFALESRYIAFTGATSALCPIINETPEVARIMSNFNEWNYTITSLSPYDTFTAIATRQKGVYLGGNITVLNDGNSSVSTTNTGGKDPSALW